MRWSKSCLPTLKETPHEAEIASHILMVRAGLIKKLTAGVYTFLPLGLRVLRNVERIVREEMDAIGCQEVMMPILHPTEIYEESGRLATFGPELFKVTDRKKRVFALGPTHEEVITMVARDEMKSYRDLPQTIYQILVKFRDEIRPRFGVMRAREFVMKDAYSFNPDDESLDETYHAMEGAYRRIIERCGLAYTMVEADSGYIGGNESHEFMVLAETGEDTILSCGCGYGVNIERAAPPAPEPAADLSLDPFREVDTPGAATIEEVSSFLDVEPAALVKTLLYRTGKRTVAVLVPGDRDVNDIKLAKVFDDQEIRFLEPGEILEATGAGVGFSGPVGLPDDVEIVADRLVAGYPSMIVGANSDDRHLVGAVAGRDFTVDRWEDLVWARSGDPCPRCGAGLDESNGVEVGHIFKLGTKYSAAMNATFLDESGKARPFIMGCYGFGISRTVAAIIEQHHDDDGIVWPAAVAPFPVMILPVNVKDETVMETAERFERELADAGVDTLVDDRDLSPGVKFKDSELIGIPLRITVGKKLRDGVVELFDRRTRQVDDLPVDAIVHAVLERLE